MKQEQHCYDFFFSALQKKYIEIFILIPLFFLLFNYIFQRCISDIPEHAFFAIQNLKDGTLFQGNFLLYFLTDFLSGFSVSPKIVRKTLCILLSLAETGTYLLLKKQFLLVGKTNSFSSFLSVSFLFVFVVPYIYFARIMGLVNDVWRGGQCPQSLLFAEAYGIIDGDYSRNMYLSYYVPTIWHNSTIIFSMPFSLAIFLLSEKMLKNYNQRILFGLTLLVMIDVLIKPSFFFIFLVSFPIVALLRYHFSKNYLFCLLPIVAGCLCLIYVFWSTYTIANDGSSVFIDISRFLHLDAHGWYRVVASLVFPLLFLAFNWRKIDKGIPLLFLLLLLLSAIGISLVCGETGPRAEHGNLSWQTVPAMQLVYFVILRNLVTQKIETPYDRTINKVFIAIFTLHVISGIWYLTRYIITGTYA